MSIKPVNGGGGFSYKVDGRAYEYAEPAISGAAIKYAIREWSPAWTLILEGRDDEPDRIIFDSDTIRLDCAPVLLYSMPPITGG